MADSLSNLSNAEVDLKVATLLGEIKNLREELRIMETDTEDRCLRQILSTFLRRLITRAKLTINAIFESTNVKLLLENF